ncbi:MAG: AAA family ATPase [Bryobacterales bacterium]|jgi:ATP-dependent Clp protease ATP-binding subunit ClpA|nr:AAA family ATPase [Bryobacterales bacterium]
MTHRSHPILRTVAPAAEPVNSLESLLSRKLIGQPAATRSIIPYVQMFQAGLAPEGRPAGVFLLLGPTGTGKTKTVEALAEVLHGSEKNVLKIDCGEFQMEHEVAKLIGAPPGYLGHRETQPMLTQQRLGSVASEHSGLSLVLFDEIEKAAPSMTRLLLGVLDKATLRLGDNSTVNFERSLIFLTSNLGAREMLKEISPDFGFRGGMKAERTDLAGKLESVALHAVKRKFSPEFVNRIDQVVTYQPLTEEALREILALQVDQLQRHVRERLGQRHFQISVEDSGRDRLLERGASAEYGARELKRTIHRMLMQPLAAMVSEERIDPGSVVRVHAGEGSAQLQFAVEARAADEDPTPPVVLIVDDRGGLQQFLDRQLRQAGFDLLAADSGGHALDLAEEAEPDAILVDYFLPGTSGIDVALALRSQSPAVPILLMTSVDLPRREQTLCAQRGFVILRKPFLAADVVREIRARVETSQVRLAS